LSTYSNTVHLLSSRRKERELAGRSATRFFLIWFPLVSAALFGGGSLIFDAFASDSFTYAAYFGMGLSAVTSAVSFFITEWAVDRPNNIFFSVAFGSIVVRIFTLLFAFALGQFLFKMNSMGLAAGMFSAYFSYLVIEIAYIHKKSIKRGQ
jgi:hypothetical protein